MTDSVLVAPGSRFEAIDSGIVFVHDIVMEPVGSQKALNEIVILLRRAAMGEEVVIAHDRTPAARLVALPPRETQRLGIDQGKYTVPDDFNNPITTDGQDVFGL